MERLSRVLDPELDESVLELGFVKSIQVQDGHVTVELRLPTSWCAPNFAFMMAEEIRRQLLTAEMVEGVTIRLKDHFASRAIEAAVNTGKSFPDAFPGETFGNLDELRGFFLRKGFFKRQEQFLRRLSEAGLSPEEICALRLGDVSVEGDSCRVRRHGREVVRIVPVRVALRYLERRAEIGLNCSPTAFLITDSHDRPITAERLQEHLKTARTIRVSLDANASLCCALLTARKEETGRASSKEGGQNVSSQRGRDFRH